MNTGLGRYLFASLVLHAGALAVVGGAVPHLPVFPASLSVALDEAPAAPADASAAAARAAVSSEQPAMPRPRLPATPPTAAAPVAKREAPVPAAAPVAPKQAQAAAPAAAAVVPVAAGTSGDGGEAGRQSTAPAPAVASDHLASQLESRLRDAMAPYFVYPLMARRRGWEGQVEVGLRVEADGRLSHLRVTRSSGHRLLDSAALATLNGIDALPGAAGWLEGRHFDMVLPIYYRLIDGQS